MNPIDQVRHTAVLRESQLAVGLIGAGVTALGKADFQHVAFYHQAFFGLSIGIERLCKLVFIADFAISNNGAFPSFDQLKTQGHDLAHLLGVCDEIGSRLDQSRMFSVRPNTGVHAAIIQVLSDFAKSTRYYNLDFLTKPANHTVDPVAAWWNKVGEPILKLHYKDAARKRDESQAAMMEAELGNRSYVLHTAETGERIDTIIAMMRRAQANGVVQRYGQLYSLQMVRWLASIAYELSDVGGYEKRIAALFCFHEPLAMFMNEDRYLKTRKAWALYS